MFNHYRPDGIDLGEDPYWLLGLSPEPLMDGKITWRGDQERITLHGVSSTLTVDETDSLVTALMRWKTWMEANKTARLRLPDLDPEERDRLIAMFTRIDLCDSCHVARGPHEFVRTHPFTPAPTEGGGPDA